MSKIIDLFGVDVDANLSADWQHIAAQQHCPFIGSKCRKVRKSEPSVAIGTCTIRHGANQSPIMICPIRMLDGRQIFSDSLHLLRHSTGNTLHVVPEMRIPGGAVDYFLATVRDGQVEDFVGIEIQTMDTTGSIWPERQRVLNSLGVGSEVPSHKVCGINWKMTAKTILVQIHHKIRTFEALNKHLVLVVQDVLMEYMGREFEFGHLKAARDSDPMQFHSYRLQPTSGGHRIALDKRYSTDTSGVARCLGIQAEPRVGEKEIVTRLEGRISSETLFCSP